MNIKPIVSNHIEIENENKIYSFICNDDKITIQKNNETIFKELYKEEHNDFIKKLIIYLIQKERHFNDLNMQGEKLLHELKNIVSNK